MFRDRGVSAGGSRKRRVIERSMYNRTWCRDAVEGQGGRKSLSLARWQR